MELYLGGAVGDGKKVAFSALITSVDLGAAMGDLQAVSVGFTVNGDVDISAL